MPAVLILSDHATRLKAARWCADAPDGSRVEFKRPRRSLDQNALLWARLTDIAEQATWHGLRLKPEDWKDVISAGLKREVRTVPNLDGDGFVMLGLRTSDMSKEEMTLLLDLVEAVAGRLGVVFSEKAA